MIATLFDPKVILIVFLLFALATVIMPALAQATPQMRVVESGDSVNYPRNDCGANFHLVIQTGVQAGTKQTDCQVVSAEKVDQTVEEWHEAFPDVDLETIINNVLRTLFRGRGF